MAKVALNDGSAVRQEGPDRFKSKVYREVVTPVALYGAECWPATKELERRPGVMEMKMLRGIAGITRVDRIRNEKIRERLGIATIADKLCETRVRWCGHVLRANKDTVCKVGLDLEIPGKRPKRRPKQRWLDTLHADLNHVGASEDQEKKEPRQQTGQTLKKKTI